MTMPLIKKSEVVSLPPIQTKPSEPIFRLSSSSRRLSCDLPINFDTNYYDVYYRDSLVSIPFVWESQPGTPKVRSKEFSIPPLTPPPSFHSSPGKPVVRKVLKNNFVTNHHELLSKLNPKKNHKESRQPRVSSPSRMSFDSVIEEDKHESSPISTLSFRVGRSWGARFRGCSSSIIKLLLGESKLASH